MGWFFLGPVLVFIIWWAISDLLAKPPPKSHLDRWRDAITKATRGCN
jgi:hypothetical protein